MQRGHISPGNCGVSPCVVKKWQVCDVSDANGTEVMGIIEAECEADANQIANEKFQPCFSSSDIIVRPLREEPKVEKRADIGRPDSYSFTATDIKWGEINKDTLEIRISRNHLQNLLSDIISTGLGEEVENFSIKLLGKLELVMSEL